MQILLVNQFFWPDSAATGQLLADVARAIESCHAVTVLCGTSMYGVAESGPPPQVKIVRVGGDAFRNGTMGRVASYASFFAGAIGYCVVRSAPTLIVTLTTPPLISLVGTLCKRLLGSKHFIWEMDLYPDIAVELNILTPESIVTRVIGALADISRKRADGIIALGDDMKARLIARGIPRHKIHVVQNWADGREVVPCPFDDGPLVIHYSGNFGLAHEEYTVAEAMRRLREDPRFRFLFVGGGSGHRRLQELCRIEAISGAEFRPYVSRSGLCRCLAEGHLGLVTQIPATAGAVVPSKTYGIMAAGRPILYIGPRDTTPAAIIEQHRCGWRVEPRDVDGMIHLLKRLEGDRSLLREAGERARRAFEKNYDKSIGIAKVLSVLGLLPSHC